MLISKRIYEGVYLASSGYPSTETQPSSNSMYLFPFEQIKVQNPRVFGFFNIFPMANGTIDASVSIDRIIDQLLEFTITKERKVVHLKEKEIQYLCKRSAEIFLSEPSLLELEGPLTVAGRRSNG